jgi:hypothetical protein
MTTDAQELTGLERDFVARVGAGADFEKSFHRQKSDDPADCSSFCER